MKKITGKISLNELTPDYLKALSGKTINGCACIHKISKGAGFSFVYLRTGRYIIQSVYIAELCNASLKGIVEGTYIEFTGTVKEESRADYGYEITLTDFHILSQPSQENPINIADKVMSCTLETNLLHRPLSLRHPQQKAIIKIAEGITDGFSEFMKKNDFTKIHSPKILADAPVNSNNLFRLKYFDRDAILSHNSMFAKQTAVAVFDRIYEIAHAYRADKHNSTRHLNEYIRLDFEMSFVNDISDIMNIQTALLAYTVSYLNENYQPELDTLRVKLPQIYDIPSITFTEALEMLNKTDKQLSLDPTDEMKLSEYSKSEYDSDFVFVTNLPSAKQPFYMMDCKHSPDLSETFVLLYKGREITYGGRKIHNYIEQKKKLDKLAINPDELRDYLKLHSYGLPPHGGAGTGLERLVAGLLNLENVKEASLLAQDMHHLSV